MPTAAQLELPELGTLGFTVTLGDPTLAAEFTFENNPGEFLGGLGGVAAIGIAAAVAIPAYQDYTVRAKVSEGLNLAAGVKAAVTAYHQEHGSFPGPADAGALSVSENAGEYVDQVEVKPGSGRIVIEFIDGAIPDGGLLVLEPIVLPDGTITWNCGGTIAEEHLPASCRGGDVAIGEEV
jgi:type IV pilus assembly protein PilA